MNQVADFSIDSDYRCRSVSKRGLRCCRPREHESIVHVEDDEGQPEPTTWINSEDVFVAAPGREKDVVK